MTECVREGGRKYTGEGMNERGDGQVNGMPRLPSEAS